MCLNGIKCLQCMCRLLSSHGILKAQGKSYKSLSVGLPPHNSQTRAKLRRGRGPRDATFCAQADFEQCIAMILHHTRGVLLYSSLLLLNAYAMRALQHLSVG